MLCKKFGIISCKKYFDVFQKYNVFGKLDKDDNIVEIKIKGFETLDIFSEKKGLVKCFGREFSVNITHQIGEAFSGEIELNEFRKKQRG